MCLPRKCPGYLSALRSIRAKSVTILMYHGVTNKPLPAFNWCQLPAEEFESQMLFLREEYSVLPLSEVIDRLSRKLPLPERAVCLTFDDGFRTVLTTAFPIMKKYDFPSTVFVITGLVDTDQPAWPELLYHALTTTRKASVVVFGSVWSLETCADQAHAYVGIVERLKNVAAQEKDRQLNAIFLALEVQPTISADSVLSTLSWDEVERLHQTGLVTFGSHTHTHQILSRLPPDAQYDELKKSHEILLERLGDAHFFAYPNGRRVDFTDMTKKFVRELGYLCGVSTQTGLVGMHDDLFELRRVGIGADTAQSQFELRMLGL
jgi:peptidoglycan/xylan/chitin deacetylase (PgdA/CDA1 family)